ncbi:serine/threonine-protein kinase [Nannocystis bainbridge]|uniref:Serine/threonine-protein kinase n=1 Tax=Nannocystis bainbridge TaxID=2995303 RepID=A0ABT5DT84_9BACT|nr:serine/threonine-protein kinase [Nannocystis bainbridge]MDC0715606.1 serine/threonine-protein kinase [Nannocystis bainbridge]
MSVGTLIAGRYRILAGLGEGGMGAVYLAEHLEVGHRVAVKVLHAEPSARASIARRFRVDACRAGSLGDPHIVEVFDAGVLLDGRLFLVMAYLEGRDLAQELEEVLVFDAERACSLMRQVTLGLATAHAAGIVHCALKPSSVMLAALPEGEVVKLLDFGLAAKVVLHAGAGEHPSHEAGAHSSSADYMAPEQAASVAATPAVDVYAVGVMLYELLSGSLPFTARHAFELLNFKLLHAAPSIDARRPGLPPRLVRLIADCLSIDPAARPADGAALVPRLDAVLADLRNPAPRPAEGATAPQPAVRRRRWPLALAAGLLLTAGVASVELAPEPAAAIEPPPPAPTPAAPAPTIEPPPPALPAPTVVPLAPPQPALELPRTEPGPKVARRPAPTTDTDADETHLSPRCQRIRAKATEARRTQRWGVLRDQSRHHECWASEPEVRKLQAKAAMELGDFSGCVTFGAGLRDPEVEQWLKLCRLRAED